MAFTLQWDQDGQRFYETGVNNGVIYKMRDAEDSSKTGAAKIYGAGEAWSGLTQVSENPTGAEIESIYADNIKYLSLIGTEELEGSIECYTYPEAFKECNGEATLLGAMNIGQQPRKKFGLVFMTLHKNDLGHEFHKLHFLYSCYASPSEKSYSTVNDSPEAITFSYDFKADPVAQTVAGKEYKTSLVIINEKDVQAVGEVTAATIWNNLLSKVFGNGTTEATFLYPDEIYAILSNTAN